MTSLWTNDNKIKPTFLLFLIIEPRAWLTESLTDRLNDRLLLHSALISPLWSPVHPVAKNASASVGVCVNVIPEDFEWPPVVSVLSSQFSLFTVVIVSEPRINQFLDPSVGNVWLRTFLWAREKWRFRWAGLLLGLGNSQCHYAWHIR